MTDEELINASKVIRSLEENEKFIANCAMSYTHDFGLKSPKEQKSLLWMVA